MYVTHSIFWGEVEIIRSSQYIIRVWNDLVDMNSDRPKIRTKKKNETKIVVFKHLVDNLKTKYTITNINNMSK